MNDVSTGATGSVIDRVRGYEFHSLPVDVIAMSRQCVLDWLGVTIAGSREPVAQMLRDEAAGHGGRPQATIVGRSAKGTDMQAAMCNGTAAHALDYDDFLETILGHPTAPVLSAALAVGERLGSAGREILTAFVAGVEAESLIGRMVEPRHHEIGWHTTATLGTFGAAAAASHLLRLGRDEWMNAFGLAGTQAAGLKAGFGTMAKPFHAGKAAANGVLAASLARRGATAAPNILETPRGFADIATDTFAAHALDDRHPEDFDLRNVLFKWHASCFLTHSLIEGLLCLRQSPGLEIADIRKIRLHVLPVHLTTCAIDEPHTPMAAKFSMRFLAALTLVVGQVSAAEFTPRWLNDPDVRALSALVQIIPDHAGPTTETPVEVELGDGRVLRDSVDVAAATPPDRLAHQRKRFARKFVVLTAPVVGPARATELIERVDTFDQSPNVKILMDRVRGVSAEKRPRPRHIRRQLRDPGLRTSVFPPAAG
jgi:2-methylcitrate dehydratase PrpD